MTGRDCLVMRSVDRTILLPNPTPVLLWRSPPEPPGYATVAVPAEPSCRPGRRRCGEVLADPARGAAGLARLTRVGDRRRTASEEARCVSGLRDSDHGPRRR